MESNMTNLRESSRGNWTSNNSLDALRTGALQRIADALEVMSKNYAMLVAERDRYERWYQETLEAQRAAERSNAALRGVITRLKRQGRRQGRHPCVRRP